MIEASTSPYIPHGVINIQFPRWPGWGISRVDLHRYQDTSLEDAESDSRKSPATPDSTPLRVVVASEVRNDYSSDSPVFFASIVSTSDSADTAGFIERQNASRNVETEVDRSQALILKFALRSDLIEDLYQEYLVYTSLLSSVQGIYVPRCLGLFVGQLPDDDGRDAACLVTDWGGNCIDIPFQDVPTDIRTKIMRCLKEIHKRTGTVHGDFAERNVLLDKYLPSGEITVKIIDWDRTETGHYGHCDCEPLRTMWNMMSAPAT
ncbi:hypothetical protein FISHEDRAFT_78798 [Fistulina hepatica ATCC 64428]|uniref:Non-specific serine/threonine protein kinase n=1 Tax=Fistulina hepatica ATCC 64428 TaxID=1128425 RepID=A0A0D7A045_9AGAR|nr:hypothetical protein FISHEDRAFT_78798 [Fistulina hepatica ATCC 64428]